MSGQQQHEFLKACLSDEFTFCSQLSSPRGHSTAVCKISVCEKQRSGAEVLEKSVRKASNWKAGSMSCIVVFSGLFLSSTLVSKNTEGSLLGRASKVQYDHCLVFPMLSSGRRDIFVDGNANLIDLYGTVVPFPGLYFGRMPPVAVYFV